MWRGGGNIVSRIEPDDGTEANYNGLNGAYTYSHMTGFGVADVAGWRPVG